MESTEQKSSLEALQSPILERILQTVRGTIVRPIARALPRQVTPNVLTGIRLVLAVPLAASLLRGSPVVALVIYAGALVTDALDGEVARLRRLQSRFGARLDPAVDKILHGAVFLSFVSVEPVLIGLLLAADALLFLAGTVLVIRARGRAMDVSASVFGKWKLIVQAISSLLLFWNTLVPTLLIPVSVLRSMLFLAVLFASLSLPGYVRRVMVMHR